MKGDDTICYQQYASSEKYVNLIKTLLEKGANPNFEEKTYGMNNIDIREPIRIALKEYFD